MRIKLSLLFILYMAVSAFGQRMDTLHFYSKAFNSQRTIYVSTPEFYAYQSEEVALPVIYLLDAQHEWFRNPVLQTIRYLQYTHQIPQALVVSIPLQERNTECGIQSIEGAELPLLSFITKEVDEQIRVYRPGNFKILIGHSFSASFSLYAYLKNPKYFSAVVANTPLDSFKQLIVAFESSGKAYKENIYLATGGRAMHEDFYHRKAFDALKDEFPTFFNSIHSFVAEHANHSAVPILATPNLLTSLFSEFNARFSHIARVGNDYQLLNIPISFEDELSKIKEASKLDEAFYPPEIAEVNGLASRYWGSQLNDYAIAIYEMAEQYYPYYYDFQLQLYELLLPIAKDRARQHLNRAEELLTTLETSLLDRQNLLNEIRNEKLKNGW